MVPIVFYLKPTVSFSLLLSQNCIQDTKILLFPLCKDDITYRWLQFILEHSIPLNSTLNYFKKKDFFEDRIIQHQQNMSLRLIYY